MRYKIVRPVSIRSLITLTVTLMESEAVQSHIPKMTKELVLNLIIFSSGLSEFLESFRFFKSIFYFFGLLLKKKSKNKPTTT